jgi:signal transduction histidine kinase/CheY-like chemotaxis protein
VPAPFEVAAVLDALSRELAIVVDASGAITWADARAARLGFSPGAPFTTGCMPGCETKAAELCRRAAIDVVSGWELPYVMGGKPVTIVFAGRPIEGGIALVGSVVPQEYADAIAAGNRAIHEIVEANRELARRKARLEESNQGIRQLHEELAQQADRLRTSGEVKGRLVASVSHEFRTPLHSILGLSRLLLDESDGALNEEQQTQVRFIRDSAEELSTLVNDMLDLSKLDAGVTPIRAAVFELRDFMSAVQGTMRPLLREDRAVELVFAPAPDVALETDQGKLGQIVRNLISNAIKFTEHGSVRVTATVDSDHLQLAVADTGIGIAPADQVRIFEEFVQIESALQRRARGTGLGLPLAKKLAAALGGRIDVASIPGQGSTFSVIIPLEHPEIGEFRRIEKAARTLDATRAPVLVVEDDRSSVFVYERYLAMAGFLVVPARTTQQARRVLRDLTPSAILLDVMLEGEDTWDFLSELKRDPETRDIPVLVCTVMNRESRARALGADEFWLKPVDQDKLVKKLQSLAAPSGARVLVVDDDAAARYLIRKCLGGTQYSVLEATDGPSGVRLARQERPHVILLDFLLEDMTAFDVIDVLKSDPRTRLIPVIIVTSHALQPADRERLSQHADAILSKEHLSRELAINRIRDALRNAGIREGDPGDRARGAGSAAGSGSSPALLPPDDPEVS